MRRWMAWAVGAGVLVSSVSCYEMRRSKGGGQVKLRSPRHLDPGDVRLAPGYAIAPVATGLTYPTGVTFDDAGRPHVVEAGYSYGEDFLASRLLRVERDGRLVELARGDNPPWNGVTWHEGAFYVVEGGVRRGGRVLRIAPDGRVRVLADGLPGQGDHHANGPAVRDGWVYFAVGTATNSGVVGPDNAAFGWLKRLPRLHDVPCQDVTLAGHNLKSTHPDTGQEVHTGAFVPYGTSTTAGQVVRGRVPCNGAILRVPIDGGDMELVAWGLRNPFGLAFAPDGTLHATDNGYDSRGSRPVWGAPDVLWAIRPGTWYGWPDYAAGRPVTEGAPAQAPDLPDPRPLLLRPPQTPPRPVAQFGVHSSSNGLDFSRSAAFGHVGEAFVAQFGDMAPGAGKVLFPVGFRVVRVDPATGVMHDFAVNAGKRNGPASYLRQGGLERPLAARFDPSGEALYLVDFGVLTQHGKKSVPRRETGVLWKITRAGGAR